MTVYSMTITNSVVVCSKFFCFLLFKGLHTTALNNSAGFSSESNAEDKFPRTESLEHHHT